MVPDQHESTRLLQRAQTYRKCDLGGLVDDT